MYEFIKQKAAKFLSHFWQLDWEGFFPVLENLAVAALQKSSSPALMRLKLRSARVRTLCCVFARLWKPLPVSVMLGFNLAKIVINFSYAISFSFQISNCSDKMHQILAIKNVAIQKSQVERLLLRLLSPLHPTLLKQDQLEQAALNYVWSGFEYHQGGSYPQPLWMTCSGAQSSS